MVQQSNLLDREPCPDRILDDTGGAYAMGAIGGGAWHFFKGLRNSPSGYRLIGAAQAGRMNSLRVAGNFAIWGTLFSASDCALVFVRNKEDVWNSVIAGGTTAGFLSMRQGLGAVCKSSLLGACLLAAVEGVNLSFTRFQGQILTAQATEPQYQSDNNVPAAPDMAGFPSDQQVPDRVSPSPPSFLSRFKGFFGGQNDQDHATSEYKLSEISKSSHFDAPAPPTFGYE